MGVKGAAIATVISQAVAVIYIISYFMSSWSIFHFKTADFKIDFIRFGEILKIGIPSFLMATIDSIVILLFNRAIIKYGSDVYIAVVGIGLRIIDLTLMPIIGITQGFSTIAGFNYGAKLYSRVKKIFWESVIWNIMIGIIVFLLLMIFPRQLLGFFSKDIGFVNLGIAPIRIIILTFPLLGFQFVSGTLFQAIGKPLPATIITLARQILFLIPAIFIFPVFWGLTGIWMTWPFSDVMDFMVCAVFIAWEIKLLNRMLDTKLKINQENI